MLFSHKMYYFAVKIFLKQCITYLLGHLRVWVTIRQTPTLSVSFFLFFPSTSDIATTPLYTILCLLHVFSFLFHVGVHISVKLLQCCFLPNISLINYSCKKDIFLFKTRKVIIPVTTFTY